MHLFCVLIGVIALAGTAVHAQGETVAVEAETPAMQGPVYAPLSYDPYYVLPGGLGYTSVDMGVRTAPSTFKELKDVSDIVAMAKFSPHAHIELGVRLALGFFKDGSSNLSSLVVGSKYQLGPNRAATAGIALPAGDISDPGLAVGLMQTVRIGPAFRFNTRLQVAALKGYAEQGLVVDLLLEPAQVFSERLSAYLDLLLTSNTAALEDDLSVRLEPNLDLGLGDGTVLNVGVSVDLQGGDEREDVGLFVVLLRDM